MVRRFEQAFAAATGAPAAVALPHARVAFQYILRVLALPAGSEVLLTPVTIPEIVSVVLMEGLRPVFVDLGERTCNMDCADLARKITPRARLLLVTHLCGIPSEMEQIGALARAHRLEILEDCSQVPGTRLAGRTLGLLGRAGFMSLTPLKPVSTFHGGMTITADARIESELRRIDAAAPSPMSLRRTARVVLRDYLLHAVTNVSTFSAFGYHGVRAGESLNPEAVREFQRGNLFNSPAKRMSKVTRLDRLPDWMYARYSDFQAQTGFKPLARLDEGNRRRRDLSLRLLGKLSKAGVPGLLRIEGDPADCTFWRFPLWLDSPARRDDLRRHLFARGIDSSPTNLVCCAREEAFADCAADTPEARRFVDEMLFLPMHSNLTDADMDRIAEGVISYYAGLPGGVR